MKGYFRGLLVAFLIIFVASLAWAADEATDITKEVLVGPGSVAISTQKDILMSFGGQIRIIPTSETNWDFGMADSLKKVGLTGYLGGNLNKSFFKDHVNESGWVNNGYIRSEDRLYFNAMPKDRKWSFYAALEFDRPLETRTVDERGGKTDDHSDFGLERLHGTMALPFGLRLHAGWDIWGLDIIDGGGLVYGDDNPGFWITGGYGAISYSVGYFKLGENNYQNGLKDLTDENNNDRDLYAGYLIYKIDDANKVNVFYAFDQIEGVPTGSWLDYLTQNMGPKPDIQSHHLGAYYTGKIAGFELFLEGVYQFGSVDDVTGKPYGEDNYDISAYAFAGDIAYDLKEFVGFTFKPHIGFIYTSGDDDPDDNELNGYTGVENAQRFSRYWGGENTIIGDTNFVLGSALYGYIPEFYGNGDPIPTGGIENFAGIGSGRGDNPGMTMLSVGLTVAPKRFIIYRTNVNSFWWNEDIYVTSFVDAATTTKVKSDYVGTEWDNELTLALSKHTFIKGQAAFFFAGDTIKDVTSALTSFRHPVTGQVVKGPESDDTAMRIAAELIWTF